MTAGTMDTTARTSVAYMDVGKGREHDHMDVGGRTNQETESRTRKLTPLRGVEEVENVRNTFSR